MRIKKYKDVSVEEEEDDGLTCYFYDDGCGNGSYISGSSCGPPDCALSRIGIQPNCGGKFSKCEVDASIARERSRSIRQKKEEIKELSKKI